MDYYQEYRSIQHPSNELRRKGGECRPDAKLKLKEKPPDFWKAFAYNTMLLFLVTICCYDLFVIVYVAPFLKQQTEIYVSFLIISVMVVPVKKSRHEK